MNVVMNLGGEKTHRREKKKLPGRYEHVGTCQWRLRSCCAAWESGKGMLKPLGYVNTYNRDKNQHRQHFCPVLTFSTHIPTLPTTYSCCWNYLGLRYCPINIYARDTQWKKEGEQVGGPKCFWELAARPEMCMYMCMSVYSCILMNEHATKETNEWASVDVCVHVSLRQMKSMKSLVSL